ncbi:MAG: hypothetical protein J3Q66DRAFT_437803 [Benniella sp.]|nr:MAG: hypothetical protein J3Q66DRAFT_437803 [Benniella sp.]
MLSLRPQDVADSKGEDRSVNDGHLDYKPRVFGKRTQHSRHVSVVERWIKNMGLTVLEERKEDLQGMKEKLEKELNELRGQKGEIMNQLNADDEPELWTKQKRVELEELENQEKLELVKLLELEVRMERLERQERLEELMEPMEMEERLEGRGDENMNRTILEGKPEEQSRVGLSILEKEGPKESTLMELVEQKGQHNSEEITFADIEMNQPRHSNDDEPFDPNTNVEAPTEFNQASDPQPERPEPIDDDDLRPRVPAIVTPTETPEMLLGGYRPDPVPATKSLQDIILIWLYIFMWSYISMWLDTSMWSGSSMRPDTASVINNLSRDAASEDQGTGIARNQLESLGLGLNFVPTAREMSQSVQLEDCEPFEDKSDLSPDDRNVKAPTEFYQAQDQPPETIDDDDLRPTVPKIVTSPAIEETLQILLGGHRLEPVSATQLPKGDTSMSSDSSMSTNRPMSPNESMSPDRTRWSDTSMLSDRTRWSHTSTWSDRTRCCSDTSTWSGRTRCCSDISMSPERSMSPDRSMSLDTASMINSLSRACASEDQDTGIARNQLESLGSGLNSVPTAREMGQSAQPEDREPFEDRDDLYADDTNVEMSTEFNQA